MPVLAQAAEDVLHIDNGIVDQLADGHGQSAQGHGVDPDPRHFENDEGDQQGERDGRQRDGRGAEIEEKNKQHDRHHDAAVAQGLFHVAHGALDEVALTENIRMHEHPLGQTRLDHLQLRFDFAGQGNGVRPGLLLHGEDDAGFSIDAGIAAFVQRGAFSHLGDLPEQDARAIGENFHHRGGQIVRRFHPGEIADEHFGMRVGQESPGGIDVGFVDGGLHFVQRDAIGREFDRINQHLVLPHVAAHHGDLRHAGNAHQPSP